MPAETPASNLKGTSPSKGVNDAANTSWGSQKGTTSPQEALSQKHTNNPVKVGGNG